MGKKACEIDIVIERPWMEQIKIVRYYSKFWNLRDVDKDADNVVLIFFFGYLAQIILHRE